MSYLFVSEQRATIGCESNRFVVRYKDEGLKSIPARTLEVIEVFGNVQLTTQCIRHCLTAGISVIFYSANGAYFGRLCSTNHVNVRRQRLQAKRKSDADYCLQVGRRIIDAKIRNQLVIVRRYARNKNLFLDRPMREMEIMRQKAQQASSMEQLMGYEGQAAKTYFNMLGKLIDPPLRLTEDQSDRQWIRSIP